MTLSTWGIVGIAALLSAILSFCITKCSRRVDDSKIGIGCFSFLGITLLLTLVFSWIFPEIIVITKESDSFKHSTKSAVFSYNGQSVSFCNTYLDNQTDDFLVLYPAYYGDDSSTMEESEQEPILIESNSCTEIPHSPNEYFYVPSSIYTKKSKKVECRWILETLNDVVEREMGELNQRKQLFESLVP